MDVSKLLLLLMLAAACCEFFRNLPKNQRTVNLNDLNNVKLLEMYAQNECIYIHICAVYIDYIDALTNRQNDNNSEPARE